MKQYKTSTLGRDLFLNGPDSVTEYEAKGGQGSCLEEAVGALIAWDTLPDFHDALGNALVKEFGIVRGIDEKATEKAKAKAKGDDAKAKASVPEKWTTYIRRVEATLTDDQKPTFDELWKSTAQLVEIDPTPSKRKSRGPGKQFVDWAEQTLAMPTDKMEKKITKILSFIPEFELSRDAEGVPDVTSLALAIKASFDASMADE